MKGFTFNQHLNEYKDVCHAILALEEQKPTVAEMFTGDDAAADKFEQVNKEIEPLEEKRKQYKTWFLGYMSVYADMHDMDKMNEISDLLSDIEHGRA